MTENQEKELFLILGRLVTGVSEIQTDVKSIKETQSKHSKVLDEHSKVLDEHSKMLSKHSRQLDHLVSKTDSIAEQVMQNDIRLSARITAVEQAVDDVGGKVN